MKHEKTKKFIKIYNETDLLLDEIGTKDERRVVKENNIEHYERYINRKCTKQELDVNISNMV